MSHSSIIEVLASLRSDYEFDEWSLTSRQTAVPLSPTVKYCLKIHLGPWKRRKYASSKS